MSSLWLVPFGAVPPETLRALASRIGEQFPSLAIELLEPRDAAGAYEPARDQFDSTSLLEALAADDGLGPEDRVLGIIDEDLCIPILTFVFGEAQLAGPAAILSLTRLRPSFYGLPADDGLLLDRVVKEALHELGHTYGLTHCRGTDCVMRASTNAGEVDLKPERFCRSCARAIPSSLA